MQAEEQVARRMRAIQLRLAGKSRSQIARALGLKTGGQALGEWLREIPPPEWTKRPRAKDDLREKAILMRREGRSYRDIREVLGVSKGSLSLWLRHVPMTEEHKTALAERRLAAARRAAQTNRALATARDQRYVAEASAQISEVAESELFVAGVVAYWSEGAKNKPWRRSVNVSFSNSDPALVLLFLRWLGLLGIDLKDLSFRLHIHESADVDKALRFWSEVIGVPLPRFQRTTLKRHNPRTIRKNVGDRYHGCIRVDVRRSVELNRRIEGWFKGIIAHLPTQTSGPSVGA